MNILPSMNNKIVAKQVHPSLTTLSRPKIAIVPSGRGNFLISIAETQRVERMSQVIGDLDGLPGQVILSPNHITSI